MDEKRNASKISSKMVNILSGQSIVCPWISLAPTHCSAAVRKGPEPCANNGETSAYHQNYTIPIVHPGINNPQVDLNKLIATQKQRISQQNPAMQRSTSQFFHFLRLMQLFPDVHPATLHTVLTLCKNDFFFAVDKLLYAKRCKELYKNRNNFFQRFPLNSNHRYQTVMGRPVAMNVQQANRGQNSVNEPLQNSRDGVQKVISDLVLYPHQNQTVKLSDGVEAEKSLRSKTYDAKSILLRCRNKAKEKLGFGNAPVVDLFPVGLPQCALSTNPISLIAATPEDLSIRINKDIIS